MPVSFRLLLFFSLFYLFIYFFSFFFCPPINLPGRRKFAPRARLRGRESHREKEEEKKRKYHRVRYLSALVTLSPSAVALSRNVRRGVGSYRETWILFEG